MCNRGNSGYFTFGNGLDYYLVGGSNKSNSYCQQCDYNYEGETHSLCANGGTESTKYTPRRFIAIQMN